MPADLLRALFGNVTVPLRGIDHEDARKLLKKYGFVPVKLVTDDLRSYGAAASDLGIAKTP
jgi:hypothetical protein